MLAPHSMTDAEYIQWGPGIPFIDRVIGESDYEEFSETHLMPSLLAPGLATGVIINPLCLHWLVYAYGPDSFAREQLVGRNTNVTGYPFPEGTWALVLLAGNFKLELIEYSQQLYGGGDDEDDDDGSDDAVSSELTLCHQQRKRRF
ncbi:hypothetical protein SO802_015188 [Lithocarpus litseifolius]|uniref:Uncharacterized protein n=1 Tax=Lithocarpus litseifolius TaxID=425828 RepID=A0AAW2CTK7_9ROSI